MKIKKINTHPQSHPNTHIRQEEGTVTYLCGIFLSYCQDNIISTNINELVNKLSSSVLSHVTQLYKPKNCV